MQSDDNQPRQDDESSQVEHTNGLYVCGKYMTLKDHCMLGSVNLQSSSRICHCHPFIRYCHCKSGGNPDKQLFTGVSCALQRTM